MEEFIEVVAGAGFELDYCQLKPDRADSSLEFSATESVGISRFEVGSCIHHHIASERGALTFGLLDGPQRPTLIEGREFHPGDLLLAEGDQGIDAVIEDGFAGHVIRIDKDHLAALAEQHEIALPKETGTERRLQPEQHLQLESLLTGIGSVMASGDACSELSDLLDTQLPLALLAAWRGSGSRPARLPGSRQRACYRAVDYIRSAGGEVRTVQQICEAVGASYSTLERGFREAYGISPKQYLVQYRLSAVRQDLLELTPGSSITDVAYHWGFAHMGKFAADYKGMFGELPSRTLQLSGR